MITSLLLCTITHRYPSPLTTTVTPMVGHPRKVVGLLQKSPWILLCLYLVGLRAFCNWNKAQWFCLTTNITQWMQRSKQFWTKQLLNSSMIPALARGIPPPPNYYFAVPEAFAARYNVFAAIQKHSTLLPHSRQTMSKDHFSCFVVKMLMRRSTFSFAFTCAVRQPGNSVGVFLATYFH